MAIGPVLAWRHGNLATALRRLMPALISAILAPLIVSYFNRSASLAALVGVALATWATLGVLAGLTDRAGVAKFPPATVLRRLCHLPRGTWGYAIAHFGAGVLIAGTTISTAWRSERIETMHPGDNLQIAGRTLYFVGVTQHDVENYTDLRRFLDTSVSFIWSHGSLAGTPYRAGKFGAQATAQSERTKPVLVANRFQAISQASMMSARLRNTELASQWLRR